MAFGSLGYITILLTNNHTFSFNYCCFQVLNGKKIMCVAKEVLRASTSRVCLHCIKKPAKQQIHVTKKECRDKII